jgi:transposase-like protein
MKAKIKTEKIEGGTEGARRETEVPPLAVAGDQPKPDPEAIPKQTRRRFTAGQKLKILRQIDECSQSGEVGAILRRNGLYSSTVSGWRRQRERGELTGLSGKALGRPPILKDPRDTVIRKQQKEIEKLQRKLDQAAVIIDIQKKGASLLGIPLSQLPNEEND